MGSEWKEVKLSDVCEIRRGSSPRPIVNYITKTTGMPWVKIADATECNSRLINKTNQYIKEEGVCRSVIVHKGDLILSNSGTAGLPKFMGITACIHDGWQVLKKLNGITKEYLYYTLIYLRPHLLHNANDSTMKNLTLDMVRDAKIRLPSLRRQEKIAQILSSIDKKIELNRQTNQTLEQMAQALFKSWFVDFDPVIDNALAAGNPIPEELQARAQRRQQQLAKPDHQPLPDDVRQLFPSEFEETEALGWVPKGWEAATLGSIASVLSGFAFKSKDFVEKGEAVIKIKNINSDRTVDITDVNRVSAQVASSAERFLLTDGDIVMAMTGATVGKFGIIVTEENEAYFLNQRVCKFSPKAEGGSVFLYSALNKPGVEEGIVDSAQGSAQPNISASAILSTPMVIPSKELIALFSRQMESSYIRRITLKKEGYKLVKLRDTLLPKLISGELRLPESMLESETNPSETAYE